MILDALGRLRHELGDVELPLRLDGVDEAVRTRDELLDQIDDYLMPRLRHLDAPLLAVVGGSTGAGKSTITNSIAGADVSAAGVLRPTTRVPVLVCHPDDESWFGSDAVLPRLARSTGDVPADGDTVQLVVSTSVPRGLGILDAPDIDSVETINHDLAAQLLGAADLWLFVTTAARYADAVPWEYLRRATERSVELGVIVNRVPSGAEVEVRDHLREMLDDNGLVGARLDVVAEQELDDGRLTGKTLEPVTTWLSALVADSDDRERLVRSTVSGALDSIRPRVRRIAGAMEAQSANAEALRALSRRHHDAALEHISSELDSGSLLRGEVVERWREHVGTGEWMDSLQRRVGRIRDRITSVLRRSPPPNDAAQGQLESNLEILIGQAADHAALATIEGWAALPGGRSVVDAGPRGLDRASSDLRQLLAAELAEWELWVLDLIRDQAGSRLAVARTLSLGINGVGVALMVAVFSSTGGLTGGEAGIAAGTAAVSQTVLTAVFGEQAVRTLARRARDDLELRLAGVFEAERSRFEQLLADVPRSAAVDELTRAADEVALHRP